MTLSNAHANAKTDELRGGPQVPIDDREQAIRHARLAQNGGRLRDGGFWLVRSHHDDRGVAQLRMRLNFAKNGFPAQLRQVKVQDDEIRTAGVDVPERGKTVRRHRHIEAFEAEGGPVHRRQRAIVFDDQNVLPHEPLVVGGSRTVPAAPTWAAER